MPRDHEIYKMPMIMGWFFRVRYIVRDFYNDGDNDAVRSGDDGGLDILTIKMMKNRTILKKYTTMPRDYVIQN